jgi:replication-associated recombination protein RarA
VFTKIPFRSIVYGSTGVGKSTLLANIIIKNMDGVFSWYLPQNIFIYAENAETDDNILAIKEYIQ